MLLGVTLDELHTEAQVLPFLVHHVLLHSQTVEDILVVDCYGVDCVFIGQDDAGVRGCKCSPVHVALIHAATSLQILKSVLVLWVMQEHLDLVIRLYIL